MIAILSSLLILASPFASAMPSLLKRNVKSASTEFLQLLAPEKLFSTDFQEKGYMFEECYMAVSSLPSTGQIECFGQSRYRKAAYITLFMTANDNPDQFNSTNYIDNLKPKSLLGTDVETIVLDSEPIRVTPTCNTFRHLLTSKCTQRPELCERLYCSVDTA